MQTRPKCVVGGGRLQSGWKMRVHLKIFGDDRNFFRVVRLICNKKLMGIDGN